MNYDTMSNVLDKQMFKLDWEDCFGYFNEVYDQVLAEYFVIDVWGYEND